MVVSHKGRIMYATAALASLLGFPSKQLTSMDLQSIIPAPYSQLHTGFLKVQRKFCCCFQGLVFVQVYAAMQGGCHCAPLQPSSTH
jgi:nitrogen-specific signal transduction histidine kinase